MTDMWIIEYRTAETGNIVFRDLISAQSITEAAFKFGYDWGAYTGEAHIYPSCEIVSISIGEGPTESLQDMIKELK